MAAQLHWKEAMTSCVLWQQPSLGRQTEDENAHCIWAVVALPHDACSILTNLTPIYEMVVYIYAPSMHADNLLPLSMLQRPTSPYVW